MRATYMAIGIRVWRPRPAQTPSPVRGGPVLYPPVRRTRARPTYDRPANTASAAFQDYSPYCSIHLVGSSASTSSLGPLMVWQPATWHGANARIG